MGNFNLKKIAIFSGIVIFALVVGYLLYRFIWAETLSTTTPTGDNTELPTGSTGLPTSGEYTGSNITTSTTPGALTPAGETPTGGTTTQTPGTTETTGTEVGRENKISAVSSQTSIAPTLSSDGNGIQYYDRYDNKFYTVDSTGQKIALSDKEFPNVSTVNWSPTKDKAVITFPDSSKIIYDFTSEKQVTVPSHWEDFSFSTAGDKLVFKSMGNDTNRWLSVVNADGTGAQAVEKIGANAYNVKASWSPNNQIIATMEEGASANQKNIYFLGLNGENFPMLTVDGRGFQSLWSPSGSNLLYSVYSTSDPELKPTLWITSASGDDIGSTKKPLELNTWAEKCVFISEAQLYCAIPRSLPSNAGMFPSLAKDIADDLYLVNTKDGSKILVDDSGKYNMKNLTYSTTDQSLYFINSFDGGMIKLNLPGV